MYTFMYTPHSLPNYGNVKNTHNFPCFCYHTYAYYFLYTTGEAIFWQGHFSIWFPLYVGLLSNYQVSIIWTLHLSGFLYLDSPFIRFFICTLQLSGFLYMYSPFIMFSLYVISIDQVFFICTLH